MRLLQVRVRLNPDDVTRQKLERTTNCLVSPEIWQISAYRQLFRVDWKVPGNLGKSYRGIVPYCSTIHTLGRSCTYEAHVGRKSGHRQCSPGKHS